MSRPVLVDTNVLLVANGAHGAVSDACMSACSVFLHSVQEQGVQVLVDDQDGHSWILSEYQNKTCPWNSQSVGDLFLQYLLVNDYPESPVISRVPIIPLGVRDPDGQPRNYVEFPTDSCLEKFDAPDRKFVAVALASNICSPIHVAADTGFWSHRNALAAANVTVVFLCPTDLQQFHRAIP